MTSSKQQWQKSVIFISLVLALLLWVSSQSAAAQNGILVIEDSVLLDFPDTIEFYLSAGSEAGSGAAIENITLTYGSNARSCQSSGSRQNMQFDAAEEVDVDWEWELKRSGAVPPGARIWWEWKLTDSEGNSHTTERQEMVISDDRHDWRSSSRDGVTVNWFRGSSAFGEETLTLALESLDRLSEQIGVDPSEEIQFWLYPTAEEVREAIVISSEWAGAVAFTDYNIMIVSLAPGEEQWAADVIPHELTHVVVGMASFNCQGGYLPVWLNEGLSVYGEGTADPSALSGLENALQEERLPSLVSLADGFSAYGGSARQAYDQSGEAVRYVKLLTRPWKRSMASIPAVWTPAGVCPWATWQRLRQPRPTPRPQPRRPWCRLSAWLPRRSWPRRRPRQQPCPLRLRQRPGQIPLPPTSPPQRRSLRLLPS